MQLIVAHFSKRVQINQSMPISVISVSVESKPISTLLLISLSE